MGSDFLFAMPSRLSGVARTLDLGATFDSYNESRTPNEADARALFGDWRAVGRSLLQAMDMAPACEPEHSNDAAVAAVGETT